jgi:hypothetical protein
VVLVADPHGPTLLKLDTLIIYAMWKEPQTWCATRSIFGIWVDCALLQSSDEPRSMRITAFPRHTALSFPRIWQRFKPRAEKRR